MNARTRESALKTKSYSGAALTFEGKPLFPERIAGFPTVAVQVNQELVDFMMRVGRARRAGEAGEMPPLPFVDRWQADRYPDEHGRARAPG